MAREIEGKLLPSELVWKESKKKDFEVTTDAAFKASDDELVSYLNLQRVANLNLMRDIYRERPQFLDKDF